jgi:hypothetical protein
MSLSANFERAEMVRRSSTPVNTAIASSDMEAWVTDLKTKLKADDERAGEL